MTLALPTVRINQPERSMLSRVADSTFWMARYVERAEHVARVTLVTSNLLMDVGELAPDLLEREWRDVLSVFHLSGELPEADGRPISQVAQQYMTFGQENPNSLANVIGRARENARGVRSEISAEMWEALNELYWTTRGRDAQDRFEDNPEAYLKTVTRGSMLFQGLTDQTLAHDQRWLFTQAGKYLERVDVTCRVVASRFEFLKAAGSQIEPPLRNIHLMACLRMCASIEAYRRQHLNELDMTHVATFLLLESNHPRSVRYGIERAHEAVAAVRSRTSPRAIDPSERILGRLCTQLEYAEPHEILAVGLMDYLQRITDAVSEAGLGIRDRYFPL